jgi:hypothetical protein
VIDVPNGLIAKKIAVGGYHACALRLNNTVTLNHSVEGKTCCPNI